MAEWSSVQRVVTSGVIATVLVSKDGGASPQINMAYSDEIKKATKLAPKSLGNQLGRWAIHLDFPVIEIAKYTGATRQTVYNWFKGSEVTPSYRNSVSSLLNILSTSHSAEEALRKCIRK